MSAAYIPSTMSGTAWFSLYRIRKFSNFEAAERRLLSNQEASLGGGLL